MMRGLIRVFRHRLFPVVLAVVVLATHAIGTALTGLRVGPTFVLAMSSVLAAGLWVVSRSGRTGRLPGGVRGALSVVWLLPVALLWASVGVAEVSAAFFPSCPPDTEGVVEAIEADKLGEYSLRVRVAPVPPEERDERVRQTFGMVYVHVLRDTRVRGQPAGGPQVGLRVRVWRRGGVMLTYPVQEIAAYIEYTPAGDGG